MDPPGARAVFSSEVAVKGEALSIFFIPPGEGWGSSDLRGGFRSSLSFFFLR